MSAATGPTQAHSLRRQWLSRLAVAFMMVAGFIGGNSLAMGGLPEWRQAGPFWLAWAGFQAVCLLFGTIWARTWKGPDAFVAGLCWKLKRFRVRMRRRWLPGRDWEAYRSAEPVVVVSCVFAGFVTFVLIPLGIKVVLLSGAGVVFVIMMVLPYYRDAPTNPVIHVPFSGIISAFWGFLLAAHFN
ncbi:hypothetical protein GAO09_22380 [Rhizobiales bacterium RZME27]|jgi:hypothetical protein|uniref:Uncharacterized protein n=1 Tax=Endobacterium cereale TaxID=2663029 RepID=A0A6A8ADF8_9HYPH|nr:hypothetical protein [Endobacterium cereale]MEB2845588.1 hypothetical protein [Endobacterium cereale]MQY48784.1 hypothetical protein [Endobacterium cereale]